ncbi:MAG: carbohydrate ABC transporter permease [Bacilli bacterium]
MTDVALNNNNDIELVNNLNYNPNKKEKRKSLEKRESRIAFCFVLIKIVGFVIFTLFPVCIALIYSFSNMDPWRFPDLVFKYFGNANFWCGFNNYVNLFTNQIYSAQFYKSIANTLINVISVPLGMMLGLVLAMILTKKTIKFKAVFRVLIYMPVVASAVAIGYIWRYIFETEYGLLEKIFHFNVNWFSNVNLTRLAIIIKNSWGSMGRSMILYLAAMLAIPQSYYEAAEIDGANSTQQFFKITLPLVSPTTFYLLVMGIIGHLQSYNDSQIFASEASGSRTVVWFIWNYGIKNHQYGLAAAASVLLAIFIMGLTIVQFKINGRRKLK